MTRLHIETPGAKPLDEAVAEAFASFGCKPLGGASTDGWSKMSELQRCPYRYYLHYVLHASPVGAIPSAALGVGGLTHAALATHYARFLPEGYPGWQPGLPSAMAFLDAVRAAGCEFGVVQEVQRLVYGYLEFYDNEDIQPVAVEYGAGIPGVHTCRFDMLAWYEGGLWIWEHKTAKDETPDVIDSWWLDGEIMGEVYGWQLSKLDEVFGAPLAGVMINLLFKKRPPTFRRLQVVIPRPVLDDYAKHRGNWADLRRRFQMTGIWPKALQGCMSRYDRCAFWYHCRDVDASLLELPEEE